MEENAVFFERIDGFHSIFDRIANDILAELFNEVLGTSLLYLTYIPSEDNVADAPSRGEAIEERCAAASLSQLKMAGKEAANLTWKKVGGGEVELRGEKTRRDRETDG